EQIKSPVHGSHSCLVGKALCVTTRSPDVTPRLGSHSPIGALSLPIVLRSGNKTIAPSSITRQSLSNHQAMLGWQDAILNTAAGSTSTVIFDKQTVILYH